MNRRRKEFEPRESDRGEEKGGRSENERVGLRGEGEVWVRKLRWESNLTENQ